MKSDARNRRSYDAGGLAGIFKRTARAAPVFMVCAVISCALGYYVFHVPREHLGTVAAVPCVVGFVMTRILALTIPASAKESEATHPSALFQALVVLSVIMAFIATDFLLSAVFYYGLGLKYVAVGALRIVQLSATIAFGLIILALITRFSEFWTAALSAAIKLLRTQTRLTDAFLVPPWHKHLSR